MHSVTYLLHALTSVISSYLLHIISSDFNVSFKKIFHLLYSLAFHTLCQLKDGLIDLLKVISSDNKLTYLLKVFIW